MLDEITTYYQDYLVGNYDCVDRIVLKPTSNSDIMTKAFALGGIISSALTIHLITLI